MLVAVLVRPCVSAFFLPVAYFHFLGQRQLVLLIENPLQLALNVSAGVGLIFCGQIGR